MSKLFVRFVKTPQLLLVSSNAVAKAPAVRCCSAFKSSIHTDNIYPGTTLASKYAQFDVTKLPTKEHVFSGYIPMNEVQFSYTLSSGAGGQNVQKVKPNLDISFRDVSLNNPLFFSLYRIQQRQNYVSIWILLRGQGMM